MFLLKFHGNLAVPCITVEEDKGMLKDHYALASFTIIQNVRHSGLQSSL